jgi:hypothetical protein
VIDGLAVAILFALLILFGLLLWIAGMRRP